MKLPAREDVEREAQAYRQRLAAYVATTPYRFTADEIAVADLLLRLARRKLSTGSGFCPCREVPSDPARLPSLVCPCDDHRRDIALNGQCYCGLFVGPKQRLPN
jgi:ferredoxin-thioredoxin reductase catalytic subunit